MVNESLTIELDSMSTTAVVPWEFSPRFGFLMVLSLWGFSRWRKNK